MKALMQYQKRKCEAALDKMCNPASKVNIEDRISTKSSQKQKRIEANFIENFSFFIFHLFLRKKHVILN
jgi:hypothetical protein